MTLENVLIGCAILRFNTINEYIKIRSSSVAVEHSATIPRALTKHHKIKEVNIVLKL